jgi:hypothetical protein
MQGGEDWLRLNTEVKELCESINQRLAKSVEMQHVVLSILRRIESQQTRSKKKE